MQDLNKEQIAKHIKLQKQLDNRNSRAPYDSREQRIVRQVANFKSCMAKSVRIFMSTPVIKKRTW